MNWTPWRKTQTDPGVPEEVRDYYQSEKRQRVGVAWLLALGTLIVTLVVAALLFLAGRWVYRSVFHKDKTNSTTASQTNGGSSTQGSSGANGNSTPPPAPSGGSSSSATNSNAGSASSGAATTAPAGTSGSASNQPGNLVDTGPGDESGL